MRAIFGTSARLPWLAVLAAFAVTGCDSGEESPRPVTPPEVDQQVPEPAAAPQAVPEPEPEQGEPELVEESASVTEEDDPVDRSLVLAMSDPVEPAGDWQFSEGRHFERLVPTQPTVGASDKIEVAEVFWYGCSHCFDFEPFINRWAEDMPPNARFVRIPATWNPLVKLHAQLYYTEEVLAREGKLANPEEFHRAVFNEYHRRGNRLASESAIQDLFERHGVSGDDFRSTWDSFEVDQKLRVAGDLADRYGISGVPTIVVNGKYRTGASQAGGYPELLDLIDELIARESAR